MYRIKELMRVGSDLVHTKDLAVLWGITNPNSLYTAINRYVRRGVLIPVQKGMYTTVPLDRVDPIRLGLAALHSYAYLSTESVLSSAGVIAQAIPRITFVGEKSRRFSLTGHDYVSRKLKPDFLLNTAGITVNDGIPSATVNRAVADLLYFDPTYHIDGRDRIDWNEVRLIQKEIGYV